MTIELTESQQAALRLLGYEIKTKNYPYPDGTEDLILGIWDGDHIVAIPQYGCSQWDLNYYYLQYREPLINILGRENVWNP